MKLSELKQIVEALLFVSDEPVSTKELIKIIDEVDVSASDVTEALRLLEAEYIQSDRAFSLFEIANGWQLRTKNDVSGWVQKLFRKKSAQKLSQRAVETLSIVAYNEPITKGRIEEVRGVNSDGIIRSLLEKDLVKIIGREKSPGNPMLYSVTKNFLTHFGLQTTKDLPSLREIDELLRTDETLMKQIKETIEPEQLGISFEKNDDMDTNSNN